jgi:hypothetical protein
MNSLIPYSIKNNLTFLALILICLSCKRHPKVIEKLDTSAALPKIQQGVSGKILFKEGEFSSSGEMLDNGKVYGVERQLLFYELTSIKDVEIAESDFVKYTSTEIIDSVNSDKHGNFSKELPEGKYSIFIKESKRLYSKLSDDDYYLPVTVMKDSNTIIIIEVDYKASYLSGR